MFKHLTLSLAALALLSACSVKDDRLACLTPVTVHIDGFTISQETLPATKAVDIGDTDPVELSATLTRVVSMLTVVSADTRPSNATQVRMTFSAGGKSFNPTTGLATVNTGWLDEEAVAF